MNSALFAADPEPLAVLLKEAIARMGVNATRRKLVERFCGPGVSAQPLLDMLDTLEAAHEIGRVPSGYYHLGHVTMSAQDLQMSAPSVTTGSLF